MNLNVKNYHFYHSWLMKWQISFTIFHICKRLDKMVVDKMANWQNDLAPTVNAISIETLFYSSLTKMPGACTIKLIKVIIYEFLQ